jgi:hypothetical protein
MAAATNPSDLRIALQQVGMAVTGA